MYQLHEVIKESMGPVIFYFQEETNHNKITTNNSQMKQLMIVIFKQVNNS
jgi:hypothetical protein